MDPLFTFNSQQLRPPSPKKHSITRVDTPTIDKTIYRVEREHIQEDKFVKHRRNIPWRHQRKLSFRGEKENRQLLENVDGVANELGQAAKKCPKKQKEREKDNLILSFRYSSQFPDSNPDAPVRGRSTGSTRRPNIQDNSVPCVSIQEQSIQTDLYPRRRIQSVKMNPRIVVPLSDRKLPKVFKVRQKDYLPPIEPIHKYESLQLRQVRSANRSRCGYLHRFHEQLEQMGEVMAEQPFLVPF